MQRRASRSPTCATSVGPRRLRGRAAGARRAPDHGPRERARGRPVRDTSRISTCRSTPPARSRRIRDRLDLRSRSPPSTRSCPGIIDEGDAHVWELGQVEVLDGGPDGDVDTPRQRRVRPPGPLRSRSILAYRPGPVSGKGSYPMLSTRGVSQACGAVDLALHLLHAPPAPPAWARSRRRAPPAGTARSASPITDVRLAPR